MPSASVKPRESHNADTAKQSASPSDTGAPRLSYAEQRERDKALRRARKKVEEAEKDVAKREQDIKDLEARMSSGEPLTQEDYALHASLTKQLENAMSLWELASMEYDELQAASR